MSFAAQRCLAEHFGAQAPEAVAYMRVGQVVVDYLRRTRKPRVTVTDLEAVVIRRAPEATAALIRRPGGGVSVSAWRFWVAEWAWGLAAVGVEGLSAGIVRARRVYPGVVARARRVLAHDGAASDLKKA